MDRTDLPAAIRAERLDLADALDDLEPAEWEVPSLCGGWTVHDVVAHLTMSTRSRTFPLLVKVARAGGDIDRVFADEARERAAAFGFPELTGQLREAAGSTHRLAISSVWDPFTDLLIHGQDVMRPLGRPRPILADHAVAALGHVWGNGFLSPRKRFEGLRLVADDADWAGGDGPQEVRGPVADLLVVAAGRPVDLGRLQGPGVATLAHRVAGPGGGSCSA